MVRTIGQMLRDCILAAVLLVVLSLAAELAPWLTWLPHGALEAIPIVQLICALWVLVALCKLRRTLKTADPATAAPDGRGTD